MRDFKIRASAAGNIMGGTIGLTESQKVKFAELSARSNGEGKPLTPNMVKELSKLADTLKNPAIPEGLKTYAKKWLISETFNRNKNVTNKYLTKGIDNEDESIEIIADQLGFGFLEKNEEYFENEFFTGTPDIIIPGKLVIDAKNSWDIHTFPHFATECPNSLYYYQLQVYMALCDLPAAKLVYVLTDTPVELIESEARRYCYANHLDPNDGDVMDEFTRKLTYSDVPVEKRIKSFDIARNESVISDIQKRVEVARNYLQTIKL